MANECRRTANSFAHIEPLPVGVRLPQGHNVDPPAITSGTQANFRLNHSMFWIRDPKASLHFYVDLIGMRTVFAMNTGPFTVYYLGFPTEPEHRSDLAKFSQDLLVPGRIANTLGLLELAHFHRSYDEHEHPAQSPGPNQIRPVVGFGHIGFTVPDVEATLERLRLEGVEVLKGVAPKKRGSLAKDLDGTWEKNELGLSRDDLPPNFQHMLDHNGFVRDPVGVYVSVFASPLMRPSIAFLM